MIKVGEEFINQVATKAVQQQIERSIRNNVQEIINDLLQQLFGSLRGRRVKRKLGKGTKRVTDLREFIKKQLEESMLAWVQEVMAEETGGDLIKYVMENVDPFEEDEEDEEDCDDDDRDW